MQFKIRNFFRSHHTNDLYNNMDIYTIIQLVIKGALVGMAAGFFGATFRYFIHYGEEVRRVYMMNTDWLSIVGWVVLMIILGWICAKLLRWAPLSGGSGIPQIEGEMMGIFDMNPYRTLVSKYLGGIFNGLCGFSVGREGPSVQLGGSVGKILAYWFKSPLREERILTSAGAAAGLTAAFSAPVSGAIFVFEEVHKSFYPMLVIPTFTAALMSNFVTSTIFGLQPSLGFTVMTGLPLSSFSYLLLLGVVMGLIGVAFNRTILLGKKLFSRWSAGGTVKIIATFLVVTMIGYDSQLLLGGGNDLVGQLSAEHLGLWLLAGIVVGKILLTALCYGSGAQGGIFLPMLVIGAAAGALVQAVLVTAGLMNQAYLGNFVICAMGGMLAAAMRTPLLSILLVLEMTNSFHSIYSVGTVAIVAYLTAELCKEAPIYDSLLEMMAGPAEKTDAVQTFFETKIPVVSGITGKELRTLNMPEGTIIVSIARRGMHLVPLGDTKLEAGDELYISCRRGRLEAAKKYFTQS
ncbi:ClC family H(+)/Cl(-) exchange transporter [Veillonella magna]|uniref:ClC family H(+)/Cl(-) exchange transporter n=1 Tax=Veillonella magna TaxID=464322 RepID=UPI002665E618|nr:chloride channel protein [Veillonella magna]